MMKLTTMALGTLAVFLGASMMASAYHLDYDKFGPYMADEWTNPGTGPFVIQCESEGATDRVNNPANTSLNGVGGLCYASSQSLDTKEEKDAKKDNAQNEWGIIQPFCLGFCPPNPVLKPSLSGVDRDIPSGDWYARIGSNTRSCFGSWDQAFAYKEMVAYYGGSGVYENGYSGHVTFFINVPGTAGSYNRDKVTTDPIDPIKSTGGLAPNCVGNDIGLTGELKPHTPPPA